MDIALHDGELDHLSLRDVTINYNIGANKQERFEPNDYMPGDILNLCLMKAQQDPSNTVNNKPGQFRRVSRFWCQTVNRFWSEKCLKLWKYTDNQKEQ